jgi:dihydrolipoamide dehydrogenase
METFDVVVIGGGPPGENAAARAVQGGLTAALVESELLGGECSYWACIPSKALLRPAEVYAAARRLPGSREAVTGPVDTGAVLVRRDRLVGRDDDLVINGERRGHDDGSQVRWAEGAGITVVRGRGRIAGERAVDVAPADGSTRRLEARHAVVVATGTRAAVPPIPGLAEARPWTSREVTNLHEVPERLVVLGGGVVACEMAQAVKRLGSREVVVLERGPRLLGRMEPFAGELVAEALAEDGVRVHVDTEVTGVRRGRRGVSVATAGAEFHGDEVLCALGRTPATTDLGLDRAGLEEGGYLETDDSMRVRGGPDWLYAIGDVTGRNLLTHMGKYQARVCGDVIVARAAGLPDDRPALRATSDRSAVPQVVFTDPQACSVGLTEEQARRQHAEVRAVDYDIASVSGAALLAQHYRGRARLVVDERRRVVLGATFVGQDVAELLHSATVAVVGEVPLDRLWHAVPSYPTVSEVWLRLLETYGL